MATIGNLVVMLEANPAGILSGFAQAGAGLGALESRASSAANVMTGVGTKMSAAITLPLVAIAAKSIQVASQFEASMNTMAAVAGVPAPQLEKLRALAMKLGADTVFSANQAAQGMVELSKSGLSTADIMGGALKNSLDLATAGDMLLADASRAVANAMNTFGLSGKQSKIAVDALAGAANASSANVSDLVLALSQVGMVAANSGQSIQQTTAFLAAMADQGVRGSDAGTSLKTMLIRLQPATAAAKQTMDSLGLSFVNADGTFKSLSEISSVLQSRMSGLTDTQRQAALQTMFGTDALRAATIAYNLGSTGLSTYLSSVSKAGNASTVAAAKMKGLPGVIEQFRGSLETAMLTIGAKMAPSLERVATAVTKMINGFVALPGPVQTAVVVMAGLAAVIGPLLILGGMAIKGFLALAGAAQLLGGSFAGIMTTLRLLGALLAGVSLPVTLVIAAIVGLAIIVVKNWDTIKAAFTAAATWIGQQLARAATFIASLPGIIASAFTAAINWAAQLATRLPFYVGQGIGAVVGFFARLPMQITVFMTQIIANVIAWGGQLVANASSAGSRMLSAVISFFAQLPAVAMSWLQRMLSAVLGFPGQVAAAGSRLGASMRDGISGAIAAIPGLVSGILRNAVNGIGAWAGEAFAAMRRVASQMWAGFKAGLGIKSPSLITRAVWQIVDEVGTSAGVIGGQVQALLDTTRSFARISIGDLGARAASDAAQALSGVQEQLVSAPVSLASARGVASPATTTDAQPQPRPIQVANLNVSLDARLDLTDPVALRRLGVQLRDILVGLERETT